MRRIFLFLSTVLLGLTIMPSASASRPIREVHPSQDDVVITDQCAFAVLGHIDGGEVVTTFTDQAGNPVKQIVIFPGNTMTLTNPDAGTSLTIMGTGSSQLRAESDGSLSARAMGHGAFFPNPITGEPGIWYLSGQGKSSIDPEGNVVAAHLSGRLVDLCPRLGG
jgi:hypothetical protein